MITETVSAEEIEAHRANGWRLVRTNVIAGKIRSAIMEKEGDPTAWLAEDARLRTERRKNLTRSQQRIASQRDVLRRRGYDV